MPDALAAPTGPTRRFLAEDLPRSAPPAQPPAPPAPRTIEEVRAANAGAAGGPASGAGDAGGTYTTSTRAPFGPQGGTDAERGQAALERTLADTSVSSQIQSDEFELIRHDNGQYTLVLPGVVDLSSPHWGLDPHNASVRDVDQFALPSSSGTGTASNRYAQMVSEYVRAHVPRGADVMIVGHSYGADTAVDLAADPVFNNPATGVNVTHVVAAAYFNQPQLAQVPHGTEVLVLQNRNDVVVNGEGVGYTATEVRNAAGRVVGGARHGLGDLLGIGGSLLHGDLRGALGHGGDLASGVAGAATPRSLPWPDAASLLRTGVTQPNGHTTVARFDGGSKGAGHHQANYIGYLNGAGQRDPAVRDFMASVSKAGYTAPGQTQAVDVSVPTTGYRTTYPGDDTVKRGHSLWDRVPGSGLVEKAVGAGARLAGDAASTAWQHRGVLADARDTVRDTVRATAASVWHALPGHDAVQSAAGNIVDHLPFNNVASAGLQALAGSKAIRLDADATQAVQQDPGFLRTEANIVQAIRSHDGYGQRAMDIPLRDLGVGLGVELGGQRGQGGMWQQLTHAWDLRDPNIRATWGVAGNELTWLLRHARLDGTAHVSADGAISIDYRISDTLDLRPGAGRGSAYNTITGITGTLWHDVLGAPEAAVTGEFSRAPVR